MEEKPHNSAISVRNDSGTKKQRQSSTQTIRDIAKYAVQGKWKNFIYSFVTTDRVHLAQQWHTCNLQVQ